MDPGRGARVMSVQAPTGAPAVGMSPAPRSVGGLFAFDEGECLRLAQHVGTPAFVYRASRALRQLSDLRAVLPPRVRVAYAVKANPLPQLLEAFAAAGTSFDVASAGELGRLQALGVSPSRIFFAGPGKRDAEIVQAVTLGVRLQAEGIEDLTRADAVATTLGLEAVEVNLRVQPLGVEESGSILGGSGPTAFGVDEEDLGDLLARARDLRRVRVAGLHGFAASNERDANRLLANHRRLFEIGRSLEQEYGLRLDQVDLGGGLGVPYCESESLLDLEALGRGLAALLDEQRWFGGEVILEPGRFLAAPCGVYLARVVRTKHSRGTHFAILEGGIHHLLRPLLTGQPFPVRHVGGEKGVPRRTTTLAGPLCTGLDRLGEVELPTVSPGDVLAFGMTGAYGATEAMSHFLDHPPAAECWWEDS